MTPAISHVKAQTSRDAVLSYLRGTQGEWASWKQLSHAAGIRYGARIFELKREGYQIEDRPSKSGTGYDYRLTGEPSKQSSLPLPSPPRLTKSARRMQDMIVAFLRQNRIAPGLWGFEPVVTLADSYGKAFAAAIERGEHLGKPR